MIAIATAAAVTIAGPTVMYSSAKNISGYAPAKVPTVSSGIHTSNRALRRPEPPTQREGRTRSR